jgi:putative oxidoreductase
MPTGTGVFIAWGITLFESIGGLFLILDMKTKWIARVFMVEIGMGIILVHARQGWFVVGHDTGGIEYSILLLASLWVTAKNE